MSRSKSSTNLSMMTHIPLQAAWLVDLPAFQSDDANLVRGCLNMLMAAFHGNPTGTLPDSDESLATAAQLPIALVKKNHDLLVKGWKKSKGCVVFAPMFALAERLNQEYSEALNRLQDATLIAMQAPDLFNSELLPDQGETLFKKVGTALQAQSNALADTKIKRRLPQDAVLDTTLTNYLSKQGFSLDLHAEIWQLFVDYHRSKQTTSASWSSEFRVWVMNQIRYGKLAPCTGAGPAIFKAAMTPPQSPAAARPTFSFSRHPIRPRGEVLEAQAEQKLNAAQNAVLAMRAAQKNNGMNYAG